MAILGKTPLLPSITESIQKCATYTPGKPIEELQRELGITDVVKLASNENPLGPSPLALKAMERITRELHLYPDASHWRLRDALAGHLGVDREELIVGNGSEEVVSLLIRSFCEPGHNVVGCASAFLAYRVCSQVHGVEYREPALNRDNLVAELDAMLAIADERTRIMFLPNPNNPTGTYVNREVLKSFLRKLEGRKIIVLLDYAYWEYVRAEDLPDPLELYREFSNVIVTRTFSKIYGLAGLRVGYGIAHPDLLLPMKKVKMPFNVNAIALAAAEAALADVFHVKRAWETNCEGMNYLEKELRRLGLQHWPSQANFLLVHMGGRDPGKLYQQLLENGVIVRPVGGYGFKEHLRISIGTMAENRRLIATLEKVL